MRFIFLIISQLLIISSLSGKIYKCRLPDGRIVYSNIYCSQSHKLTPSQKIFLKIIKIEDKILAPFPDEPKIKQEIKYTIKDYFYHFKSYGYVDKKSSINYNLIFQIKKLKLPGKPNTKLYEFALGQKIFLNGELKFFKIIDSNNKHQAIYAIEFKKGEKKFIRYTALIFKDNLFYSWNITGVYPKSAKTVKEIFKKYYKYFKVGKL